MLLTAIRTKPLSLHTRPVSTSQKGDKKDVTAKYDALDTKHFGHGCGHADTTINVLINEI
jgi:hypothetical protein